MSATTTIPVEVTPEAQSYLDQLGMGSQFQDIIDRLRRTVPRVSRMEARVEPPDDVGDKDVVVLRVERPLPPDDDRVFWNFGYWLVQTYPPGVLGRIIVLPF